MIAGSQEDARDARRPESFEERLVVRHDDGAMRRREVEERVVRGPVAFHPAVLSCETQRGPGVPIGLGEDGQLRQHGRRDRDLDIAHDSAQLRVEVDLELERHQEGVRVEQDEPRHRFRASVPNYMGLTGEPLRWI